VDLVDDGVVVDNVGTDSDNSDNDNNNNNWARPRFFCLLSIPGEETSSKEYH